MTKESTPPTTPPIVAPALGGTEVDIGEPTVVGLGIAESDK